MHEGLELALINPAYAGVMADGVVRASAMAGRYDAEKPYAIEGGVAVIPVCGVLLDKFNWACSWATGYDFIRSALIEAFADPMVQGIVFDIDSYGGLVSGCFDLVDWIFEAKQEAGKPIAAILSECAYSAAYAIASVADQISVPRTGGVGSVGVVTMHVDYSGMFDQAGIKVTLLKAGEHKTDGNPYEPLPDDVKAEITVELEAVRTLFAETVARNRSQAGAKLSTKQVLDTEARTFDGLTGTSEAIRLGFADAIAAPDEAFAVFQSFVQKGR